MNHITIDPVAMNIRSKIGRGSVQTGSLQTTTGLLVEGEFTGQLRVTGGPLVVAPGGVVRGSIDVEGDLILLGAVESAPGDESQVVVHGKAVLAAGCVLRGTLRYDRVDAYEGASIAGQMISSEWRA